MFRVGFLGCGGIANAHARVLSELGKRVQLAAFCDLEEERARRFNQTYADGKGKVYINLHRMLNKEKLDVLYICLPPFAHADEVELAAERGVHIFIEKPVALDMETAGRMVEAVERTGVKSQVGFQSRFGDAVREVKRMLDSGEAGRPGLVEARYFCNSLHSPWWRDKSKSGGQVVEQVIHTFDILRYFLGEPEAVFSFRDNLFHRDVPDYTVEDVSATVVRFKNGAVATVAATNGAIPGKWISDYKLVTERITVYFESPNQATVYHTGVPHGWVTSISSERPLQKAAAEDLLDAIEDDRETLVPIQEGARSLELVLAVARSGEQGTIVHFKGGFTSV
ncbi:MAG TPA: Gfo/Idh/MocA family oxidoreductase [Candidatus Latescibacteria bacterium]|nr:Gfo/Idh/MocA family oxidoreductase [Candidatus Latescibacterota bacterium]